MYSVEYLLKSNHAQVAPLTAAGIVSGGADDVRINRIMATLKARKAQRMVGRRLDEEKKAQLEAEGCHFCSVFTDHAPT